MLSVKMIKLMDSELGYYFYPRRYPHSPGHPQLEVHIYATPTFRHFDPQHLHVPVTKSMSQGAHGPIEQLVIPHPWSFANRYRVCPGALKILDRLGKSVDAFSYGGTLSIRGQDDYTICSIESPAPILEIGEESAVATILAEESEILLAERRAAWSKERDFEERLGEVDPLELYIASLDFLRKKYDGELHRDSPQNLLFLNFLHHEISALRSVGHWPFLLPDIDDIL